MIKVSPKAYTITLYTNTRNEFSRVMSKLVFLLDRLFETSLSIFLTCINIQMNKYSAIVIGKKIYVYDLSNIDNSSIAIRWENRLKPLHVKLIFKVAAIHCKLPVADWFTIKTSLSQNARSYLSLHRKSYLIMSLRSNYQVCIMTRSDPYYVMAL